MLNVQSYLEEAVKNGASDIHLVGNELPMIRVAGNLQELGPTKLNNSELEEAIGGILTNDQKSAFANELELDFGYNLSGSRFRLNLHKEDGNIGLAGRLIPKEVPNPESLRLEPAFLQATKMTDGLVLVTGPTGCGKSTSIASIIEEINKNRKAHIVTIEDPVEFVFEDKKSLIEQREVGTDTKSFAAALKHVLRQDPNVIFVGEMRDQETIATALTAAETGHLVFSTLHTPTAAEAVERIVDVFEGTKQKQILVQLSSVLRMVVAQQLVPGKDGKRVAAREILVITPAVANMIRENNISQIKSAIQTGAKEGMITMENSIKKLAADGLV